jgi:hypothetical protein
MFNPSRMPIDETGFPPMPSSLPIVFVVADDISVRESLEPMIRRAGGPPA